MLQQKELVDYIFKDKTMRLVVEALLLDSTTPQTVMKELVGLDDEGMVMYKEKYMKDIVHLPRLMQLSEIRKIKNKAEREVKEDVFFNGWESVAAMYLKGKYVDGVAIGHRIATQMLSRLGYMGQSNTISKNEMSVLRELIKQTTATRPTVTEEVGVDEWEIMLADIETAIVRERELSESIKKENQTDSDETVRELLKTKK